MILDRMAPAEPPTLLDDAGFLAELERLEYLKRAPTATATGSRPPVSAFDETARHRAHVALERALEPEYHHQQQRDQSKTAADERSRGQVPRRLVLLVLILGLLAGAGVAGVMFYDRVALFVVERVQIK